MIYNARIKYTHFSEECKIGFAIQGGKEFETVYFSPDLIKEVLNTLEVRSWEDLKRKFARIDVSYDNLVIRIGNIIEDKWVSLCLL
jgi:hypothetical protein